MQCKIERAIARHDAKKAAASGPIMQFVLSRTEINELYTLARGEQEFHGCLVAVTAVMVTDVKYLTG